MSVFNPYKILKAATLGDAEAYRQLARCSADICARDGDLCAMFEALVFARLGFTLTGSDADAGLLLALFAQAQLHAQDEGESDLLDLWQGEAIALASLLADRGSNLVADALPAILDGSTAAAAKRAKEVRALMDAA